MLQIVWNQKQLYDDVKDIQLPRFIHYMIQSENDTLYAVGIMSSFEGLQYHELQMINEGFSS